MIFKDFKIAFPDPSELVEQTIPLKQSNEFVYLIHAKVKAGIIIDTIVVFKPVSFEREFIYSTGHVFFKHLN